MQKRSIITTSKMVKESFSYKLESRPGQLLVDHLTNTAQTCSKIREINFSFGLENDTDFISEVAWLIGFTHDLGKATRYFQEYLKEDDEERKALLKNKDETHHSLLSSLFTYKAISDYIAQKNLSRHKLFGYLPILAFVIVKRHHSNPVDLKDEIKSFRNSSNDLSIIKNQLGSIPANEFNRILENYPHIQFDLDVFNSGVEHLVNETISKEEKKKWREYCRKSSLDMYFLFQFLYSALLSADKSDAIGVRAMGARPALASELVDRYRAIEFPEPDRKNQIDPMRNEIYDEVVSSIDSLDRRNRIFSINVPTGTGKTLTGFSFALKLREKIMALEEFAPRIIYCLPFLSIIEQNFGEFEKVFKVVKNESPDSRILLKHHHLAEIAYRFIDDEELPIDESLFFIEGWESEIVVTTFMQLFHTLISNRNRMIRKFNAMANSIIILDEIQTIPYKYWQLIKELFLRFSSIFNTRFVLMTATQPLIFNKNEVIELVSHKNKEKYIKQLNRITFINRSDEKLTLDEFKLILREDIAKHSSDDFLIVLNTINCSIEIFKDLKTYMNEQGLTGVELYYLSTNIIPKHRLQRIECIKKSVNRKIVVSTQLVEAGVDIDVDRVYRDFAPLDSLNQIAGRCNRNFTSGKMGVVTVYSLIDSKPFYRYIYGKGDISISKTKDVLRDKSILSEEHFLDLGNDYFRKLREDQSSDDAEYMMNQIGKLNFHTVCDDKKERFRLIDSEYPTRDLFIEVDGDASDVWEKYIEARQIKDPFDKKSEINRLKKHFYHYIISVPAKSLPGRAIEDTAIVFINKEQVESIYDEDTGFIRKDPEQHIF